jgi:L-2-hydroxyglutarate oxidase LhgO
MSTTRYDIAVIGGGIIGLATAMQLSASYPRYKVVVVEKEQEPATHQTGHNSGVIHSGLYYRPGSLKATLCVQGGRALREFCDQHGIRYESVGKVVVATRPEELPALNALYQRGTANGVEGLEMIGPERLRELEPHAYGIQAIHCPSTGIVDFKEVARAYATEMQGSGVELLTGARVMKIRRSEGLICLETARGDLLATHLINCAGLYADVVVGMMGLSSDVRIIPFRGEYYTVAPAKHHLVNRLIYPVPNPKFPFLGVHFTRRVHGGVEAGPNAMLAFAREGYHKWKTNPSELARTVTYRGFWAMARKYWKTGLEEFYRSLSKKAFTRALQRLVPEIQEKDLVQGGAGVRAQAVDRNGNLLDDFSILETESAFHVLNAPSPAATSSLAIGKYIANMASRSFSLAH